MRKNMRKSLLNPGEIIPLSFDVQFNRILNNEENIIILENFLAIYFERPVEDFKGKVKLVSRDIPTENKNEHDKQVDLIVDIDGEKTNIELNNNSSVGITNRNLVMACSIHGKQLKYQDRNYSKIKKTVQININNFACNNNKAIETYYLRNEDGSVLTKKFRIDVVDVAKITKKEYNGSNKKLSKFLKALNVKNLSDFKREIGGIMEKEAENKLIDDVDKYSRDDEVIALYSAYSKQELEHNTILFEKIEEATEKATKEGLEKGLEQGLEEGMKQKNLEIAKKMVEEKLETSVITKITGLSTKEIENLNN